MYFKKNFKEGNLNISKNGSGKNELNYGSDCGPAVQAFRNLQQFLKGLRLGFPLQKPQVICYDYLCTLSKSKSRTQPEGACFA